MRVAIFEVEEWERETFRRLGPDYDVQFLKSAVTPPTRHIMPMPM